MSDVSQEEVQEAMRRYPGLPVTLAVTRYMLDKNLEEAPAVLHPGAGWGGIHLETVGMLVQKLANAMYQQRKKAINITIEATDFPESWDHIWVEVKDVDSGTPEEIDRMGLAGWPCCACDEVIRGDDNQSTAVTLEKLAKWQYPSWGNVLLGTGGLAIAVMCGRCVGEERPPLYAVKKDGEAFVRVPVSELEDEGEKSYE